MIRFGFGLPIGNYILFDLLTTILCFSEIGSWKLKRTKGKAQLCVYNILPDNQEAHKWRPHLHTLCHLRWERTCTWRGICWTVSRILSHIIFSGCGGWYDTSHRVSNFCYASLPISKNSLWVNWRKMNNILMIADVIGSYDYYSVFLIFGFSADRDIENESATKWWFLIAVIGTGVIIIVIGWFFLFLFYNTCGYSYESDEGEYMTRGQRTKMRRELVINPPPEMFESYVFFSVIGFWETAKKQAFMTCGSNLLTICFIHFHFSKTFNSPQ